MHDYTYDKLQQQYRVLFEGQPFPIFYKYFYPTGNDHEALWELFRYARGLKQDKDSDKESYRFYSEMVIGDRQNLYDYDLRQFFNAVFSDTGGTKNAGVIAIPSSKMDKVNRVTKLICAALEEKPGVYTDLSQNIYRRKEKATAHSGGGRNIAENAATLGAKAPDQIRNLDLVMVIDDIVTTGNSFRAMTKFLQEEIGFQGTIINFAFARHSTGEVAKSYLAHDHSIDYEAFPKTKELRCAYDTVPKRDSRNERIRGVIYDLDQTLIDDSVRNIAFEEVLWKRSFAACFPYKFYDGIKELMALPLACAIVSNRPSRELDNLSCRCAFTTTLRLSECPKQIFSFPVKESNGYKVRYYKPHPAGVKEALCYLREDRGLAGSRIIGVGNTKEDIIAYKSCGIEAVLALWGVPDWLKSAARNSWSADFAFERVDDFRQWLEAQLEMPDCYEKGKKTESADRQQAYDYYEKAIQSGPNIRDAALAYARLVRTERPSKAIELYQLAIDEGDERTATNGLALLVQRESPERAAALFERAIAAGNRDEATRNLAMLIKEDDPERAIKLLRQAAEAGNDKNLAADLEPLIEAGSDSAIQLYKDVVVAKDGKKAYDLGCKVREDDPEAAKELFETAIEAGDERCATFMLAEMLAETDKDKARSLYQRSIDAGDSKWSPNGLANLIQEEDPKRAISLLEMSIRAGDTRYATRNLANLIKASDPKRAVDLLTEAAQAGNKDQLYADLEPLMREGYEPAIHLCRSEVISQKPMLANGLGMLIESRLPAMAKTLYEIGVSAGDLRHAASNLARMIEAKDPDRAEDLYRRSIAAGSDPATKRSLAWLIRRTKPEEAEELLSQVVEAYSDKDDICALGIVAAYRDLEKGKQLLHRAENAGDTHRAPCKLAHLMLASDPDAARRSYEAGLELDEPEAWCGLAYILKDEDPSGAEHYLNMLHSAADIGMPMESFLDFVALADKKTAISAGVYFADKGFEAARRKVLELCFGSRYVPKTDSIAYGKVPSRNESLQWLVLRLMQDRVLLLAKSTMQPMPYIDGDSNADWSASAIRSWLNGAFAQAAFGDTEDSAGRILRTSGDLVTCLTPGEYSSLVENTPAAELSSIVSAETTWWLKAVDNATQSAPYVKEDAKAGWSLALVERGVRPAIWLALADEADASC